MLSFRFTKQTSKTVTDKTIKKNRVSCDNQILLTSDPKLKKYTNFQNLGNIKRQLIGDANVLTLAGAEESFIFFVSLK